ncbi:LacI family DNA-binding transcriptional regulator [Amaricoccus sp.]|uniref:LacI family DNA-binding transcriptional regulator n=1 Tax=Amaricoccus sp. TaxID=1872485 RepID=UPI001B436FED|nr:LacI family DNA-binding transcriptional regulator [Amaricoccus sp.]MBP7241109.1 LacI family DNA-binding transcriptional regulator [Amaricoccus sp.]
MSRKGKTLKDLAAKLDISVATASRALSGHARIAPETRERVAAAAREIGYVPNRAARALVSGRSGLAALALPVRGYGVGDAFLGEFVSGLTAGLGRTEVDLILTTVPASRTELDVIRSLVVGGRADGVVIARVTEADPRVEFLTAQRFPFVAHGRTSDGGAGFSWLDTDGHLAFAQAFDMLHALGHRRFALVTIDEPTTFRAHREAGLRDGIAVRADPAVTFETIAVPRFDRARRAAAVRGLLGRADRPTAVLGVFDGIAIGVIEEAAKLGIDVPGGLSVVGFDNTPEAALAAPGLTTFDSLIHQSAEAMAGMLTRAIADPDAPPETRLIRPPFVPRGSHGPAPG